LTGGRLRQPEVEQLHARLRHHDVRRLEVAMNDPLAMGLVQRIGDLDPEAQNLGERQWAFAQAFSESLAFEVLHHQVIDAVLAADIVESADVRMRERGDRARFAFKSHAPVSVFGQFRREHFDRDRAIEARVAGAIDLSHAAGADRRDDFVGTEPRSAGESHAI